MVVLAIMIPLMVLALGIATVPIVVTMLREDRARRAELVRAVTAARFEREHLAEAA